MLFECCLSVFPTEPRLTYTLCCLGRSVAVPAVTLATVLWPLVQVQMALRRFYTAPLEWQEIFIWRETFDSTVALAA